MRRPRIAGERTGPHFDLAEHRVAEALDSERILIDCDHLAIGENRPRRLAHLRHVVSGDERRREHAPHREVCAILGFGHPVPDLEHVGIVPVIRPRVRPQPLLLVEDLENAPRFPVAVVDHAVEAARNVARGPPQMPDRLAPKPRPVIAPFADAQNDGPPAARRASRMVRYAPSAFNPSYCTSRT